MIVAADNSADDDDDGVLCGIITRIVRSLKALNQHFFSEHRLIFYLTFAAKAAQNLRYNYSIFLA